MTSRHVVAASGAPSPAPHQRFQARPARGMLVPMWPLRSMLSLAGLVLAGGCSTFRPSSAPPTGSAPTQTALASLPARRLLAVADEGRVRLLDSETGDTLAESFGRDAEGFVDAALAPDGTRVALTTWTGRLVVYERAGVELRVVAEVKGDGRQVRPQYARDGALAAIRRDQVVVWPTGDARGAPVSLPVGEGASDIAFRPSDGHVGVAFSDRVETWSVTPPRRGEVLRDPEAHLVAFASNGSLAAGSAKIVVLAPEGRERVLEGPSRCDQLAWDGAGVSVACRSARDVWVCTPDSCDALETKEGERAWSMLAPAAEGFFLSRGDGRVVHRRGRGRERAILTDGFVDRRRASP